MTVWEQRRDAFIAAHEYGEIPDDLTVFMDMLRAGEFDETLLGEAP